MAWEWMEGSRGFDLAWGAVTGALCLALAVALLRWWLPAHRRSVFGAAIDPRYRLQLGYGLFCLAMAGTNVGCRAIVHDDLGFVHPVFFLITVALYVGLAPRLAWLVAHPSTSSARRAAPG